MELKKSKYFTRSLNYEKLYSKIIQLYFVPRKSREAFQSLIKITHQICDKENHKINYVM